MDKIIFSKKQIGIFKKMGIQTIYLFGSRAQNRTHNLSDFDIGVVFNKPEKYRDKTLDVYSKLYDVFTDVLPKKYLKKRFELREHEFDIVFLQFAPIAFQFEAVKKAKVLYQADQEKRLDYEEYLMKKQSDLRHFHNMRQKAILERI